MSSNLLEFMDSFIYECYNKYSCGCATCKFIYALDIDSHFRCISLFLKDILEDLYIIDIDHGED